MIDTRFCEPVKRLATVVSLAARIEPELLRAARLRLLPDVDVAAEADLWFSDLVVSRSTRRIVLDTEAATSLRQSLANDPPLLVAAHAVVAEMHVNAPAAIQIEEEILYLALTGDDVEATINTKLMSVLNAIANEGRRGLIDWAARALPSMPELVRNTTAAAALGLVAGSQRTESIFARRAILDDPVIAALLQKILPRTEVYARLVPSNGELAVEISRGQLPGSHAIDLPKTEPLVLELTTANHIEVVDLPREGSLLRQIVESVSIRTISKDVCRLEEEVRGEERRAKSKRKTQKNYDYDLIIIGGGIIGGSTLYHLSQLGYEGRVLIIEREDAVSKGSTALAAGGFRNIWTTPINMQLTSHSIRKLKSFQEELRFPIGFDQHGYLFCLYRENFDIAKRYAETWSSNGVRVDFLNAGEVERKVPGLRTGIDHIDSEVGEILEMGPIVGGVFGPECGSFDPSAAAQGYLERGLEGFVGRAELRLNATVKKLRILDGTYRGVEMQDGSFVESEKIFVAAGAWTNALLEASGLSGDDLPPVIPLNQMLFITNMPPIEGFEQIPMTIIDNGIYFRTEGPNLMIGRTNPDTPAGFDTTPDARYYEEQINPYLQERIPGMERCRLMSMWGGLDDVNDVDFNAVLGEHPHVEGLLFATGFSGHGAMEAPAVGLALAELVKYDEYRTIDCSPLSIRRFWENNPIHETIIQDGFGY
jgi:FAD-dependent oxidoreductase domain-containing protein 1